MVLKRIKFNLLLCLTLLLFLACGCGHTYSLGNTKQFNSYSAKNKAVLVMKNGDIWDVSNIRIAENMMFWTDTDNMVRHHCRLEEVNKVIFTDKTRGYLYGALGGGTAVIGLVLMRSMIRSSFKTLTDNDETPNEASRNIFAIGIVPATAIGIGIGTATGGMTGVPQIFVNDQ